MYFCATGMGYRPSAAALPRDAVKGTRRADHKIKPERCQRQREGNAEVAPDLKREQKPGARILEDMTTNMVAH